MKQIILMFFVLGCSMEGNELSQKKTFPLVLPAKEVTNCRQTNLSEQFDVSFNFERFEFYERDSCVITIHVQDRKSAIIVDSFIVVSEVISAAIGFSSDFSTCENMVSYSTKYNTDRQIVDNHFGDLIVADFNFDGKDDIAVINDSGGNGGPLYSFFIQQENKKFSLDPFLTDSMVFFPTEINPKNRTLTTEVHAGVCHLCKRIFKFDRKRNVWTEKSSRLINVCLSES